MWNVVLKILSILGMILLILLGVLLTAVLLVLFVPVVYQGNGTAHEGEYRFRLRFRWLLGLVRGEFTYPAVDGATLRVHILWLTIYDNGRGRQDDKAATEKKGRRAEPSWNSAEKDTLKTAEDQMQDEKVNPDQGEGASQGEDRAEFSSGKDTSAASSKEKIITKLSNLKDKLQFCLTIVQDEDNHALVGHAAGRLGRIIKSMHPRVLRLKALIGLGEPDKTGYAYGAFWAVKPFLGKCQIDITPDFERQVIEGEVFLRGRIMSAVLLYHIIRVILDKRLRQLIDRLKKMQENGNI